jgi:hypothetical protein
MCVVFNERIDAERFKSRLHGVDIGFSVWKTFS